MGRVRIIAVGSRMPKWVQEPFDDYLTRLSAGLKVTLTEIEPGSRTAGRPPAKAIEAEGQRILDALFGEHLVQIHRRRTLSTDGRV